MDIKIPDFSKANVLVVGDLMLDRYWYGEATRISPEAPVPVMKVKSSDERPGGAGNVALNLSGLGVKASLLAITGDDQESHILESQLSEKKINCYLQRVSDMPTIAKLRALSQHQQLIRLDFEEGFKVEHTDLLLNDFKRELQSVDVVILSDYGKGTLNNPQQFIQAARDAGVPVFIDPKQLDFSVYKGATLVTPNMKEFEIAVGPCANEEEMSKKAHELIKKNNIDALLVTRGEHGMSLFQKDKDVIHVPTRAQEIFDVTGAGDTVIATLAAAFSAGNDFEQAMRLANAAAGISVGKLGAATVTVPELRRELYHLYDGMPVTEEQLLMAVADAKAHGEKVVMTNGCFDILHAGHVHYLEQAKALGDRLIIAVNDDESTRRLKGEGRPINNIESRMKVLAGLTAVDWVIPFSEDTPERVIGSVLPDILVKGGDWKLEQIAGGKSVLENGGEVKVLDFLEGKSTTSIIDRVKKDL